ncbi:MAG: hypothetical protein FJW31_30670 [Acidobacteria bacterium]|nr:hypothetical protein [Acidobacteriota bacterium]
MLAFTGFGWLFALWLTVTAFFTVLVLYRSVATLHEEDQIFLDPAEAQFAAEQRVVVNRIERLDLYVRRAGATSASLLAAMLVWIGVRVVGF